MNLSKIGGHSADHLKRQAKKLKKQLGVTHVEALEIEAQKLGFSNYKNFLNNQTSMSSDVKVQQLKIPKPAVLPYRMIFAKDKRHRPNAKMPISDHQTIGTLLKEVLADTFRRKSVTKQIELVRCELDDWIQQEYKSREELSDAVFFDIYYHGSSSSFERTISHEKKDRLIKNIKQVKNVLIKAYHDCLPLRSMLKRLDASIVALEKWANVSDVKIKKAPTKAFKGKLPRGTLVRLRPFGMDGVVLEHNEYTRSVTCYTQSGTALLSRHEVWYLQDQSSAKLFKPMRLYLPYGKWTCANGTEVLFNRDYCPIWTKTIDGQVNSIAPDTWILYQQSEHYVSNGTPWKNAEVIKKCENVLKEWGVLHSKPQILDVFDRVLQGENPDILQEKDMKKRFPSEN